MSLVAWAISANHSGRQGSASPGEACRRDDPAVAGAVADVDQPAGRPATAGIDRGEVDRPAVREAGRADGDQRVLDRVGVAVREPGPPHGRGREVTVLPVPSPTGGPAAGGEGRCRRDGLPGNSWWLSFGPRGDEIVGWYGSDSPEIT